MSTEQCREVSEQSCCPPHRGMHTLDCFLNTGLWNLGIRIRNGAYTAFSAMWSTGLLTGGGRDIVSGAGSGSMENSKRVCGPVCRGLRDVPTFPPIFGVHWQKRLLVTPEARRASVPMLPSHLAILLVLVLSSSLLRVVLVCGSHTLSYSLAY